MLNHILVPLDNIQNGKIAIAHAAAFALAMNAQVTLLRVLEQQAVQASAQFVDPLNWQISKTEAEIELDQAVNRLETMGLQASKMLLESPTPQRLIQFATDNAVDLIVTVNQGMHSNPTIQEIMVNSQIPVLVIPAADDADDPETPIEYRRLLAPLDGSPRAECALPMATTLARAWDAMLILAHVVRLPEMPRRVALTAEEIELADRLTERNRAEAASYLEQLSTRVSNHVETRLLVNSSVAPTLHQLVVQENIDLTILSAHGYTGQSQRPYSSLVSDFIAYSSKPVLVVQDLPITVSVQTDVSPRESQGR